MSKIIPHLAALFVIAAIMLSTQSAAAQIPAGDSPIERGYTGVKLLGAYFGTAEERLEIEPGDLHVPFTIFLANVGNTDIVGLKGDLTMPINFGTTGTMEKIRADADSNVKAGEHFTLTFYTDVGSHTKIGKYKGTLHADYSRLRESGQRSEVIQFDFELVGKSRLDASAPQPFVNSFGDGDLLINLKNTGSATASSVVANLRTQVADENMEREDEQEIVIFESSWNVGSIGAGDNANITARIYVPGNLAGQTVRLPLEIQYFDAQGVMRTIERSVDIYVRGLIDLNIYGIKVMSVSDRLTLVGNVLNEGNEEALFAFVTIYPLNDSNIRPVTQFVDDLDTDSPVPFNMPIEFDGEPRYGDHQIRIDVRYKDGTRNETVVTHEDTVFIYESVPEEGNMDYTAVAILAAIAIVVAALITMRKKRSNKD